MCINLVIKLKRNKGWFKHGRGKKRHLPLNWYEDGIAVRTRTECLLVGRVRSVA